MVQRNLRQALSLLELLVAVAILGILAAVVIPRLTKHVPVARASACSVQKENIEVQVQLWYRMKRSWPADALGDIGGDASYFPEGLPVCPVDGSAYTLNPATHRVNGHNH